MTFRPTAEQVADLEAVMTSAERLADLELVARVHLYLVLARIEGGQAAHDPAVRRSLDRLTEIGTLLDDPSLAALPLAMVAMGKIFTGPIGEGVEALERAIPLMEKRRDFIGAAFSRGWLAMGYAWMGDFEPGRGGLAAGVRGSGGRRSHRQARCPARGCDRALVAG